ncbi:hypothetical protein [Corynebacterium epidermidicanis]|uniref:Uncharacterized protein n=1 Tax=Corynebacterium epidermidicanis TaxID=1050174 RepID=A0A0G3GU12_9CORY|nr:hypothetical protein [Corynebacterium epidermidicanis]AKK04045.1 hypothetical protein CEPID_11080 [Corynebacterium epidermidicanis]
MTSLGPSGHSARGALAPKPVTNPGEAPESVMLAFRLWLVVVAVECLHQVMNIVIGVLDPSELKQQAHESMSGFPGMNPTEQQFNFAVYFSLVLSGLIAMSIMGIVAYGAYRLRNRKRFAENMRRMLLFFGIYLAMRGLMAFLLVPQGSVPIGVVLFDGVLIIIVAIAATLAAILGSKPESVEWARSASTAA